MRMRRAPCLWVVLLAFLVSGCLGSAPTAVPSPTPLPPTPRPALPLPALPVPATAEPTSVSNGALYATLAVPHFRIRYLAADATDVAALPAVIAALEKSYGNLAGLFGDAPDYPIPIQFEHDPGVAHVETAGIVLYRRNESPLYVGQATHALTHVFTGYTGYPFFEEGLAVYATMLYDGSVPWPLNGVPARPQTAGFLDGKTYTPLAAAFKYTGLGKAEYSTLSSGADTGQVYLEAGAFAQFMIARYGLDAYRALSLQPNPAAGAPVPGQVPDLDALEAAFQTWLRTPAAAAVPPVPALRLPAPTPAVPGPAPDAAALLTAAVQTWGQARGVRFTISKLGHGEWLAPDYLHLFVERAEDKGEVVVLGDVAYSRQGSDWTRLPPARTPESGLAATWIAIGDAARPASMVRPETLDGRAVWRASYFLADTPDVGRYKVGGNSFITVWYGVEDGRVYRLVGPGYDERFLDWDAPIEKLQPAPDGAR